MAEVDLEARGMKLAQWLNEQPSHLTPNELLSRLWSRACAIEAAERKRGDAALERAERLETLVRAWDECRCPTCEAPHGYCPTEDAILDYLLEQAALAPAPAEERSGG